MGKIDHENIKAGDEVQIDDSPNWRKVHDPCYGYDWLDVSFVGGMVTSVPKSLITAHRPAKPKSYGDMVFDVPKDHLYFFVDQNGDVDSAYSSELYDDEVKISLGVFLTFEAAEKHARKLKAIAALKQEKGARPFVVLEDNWVCYYDHKAEKVRAVFVIFSQELGYVTFDTEENALAAYTKHAKDLWGVE